MKIDGWTLALQSINVLVLLWVLRRFLFKPVLAIIAQRQLATQKLLDDAAAVKKTAEAECTALAAERYALAGNREQTMAAAQAEAQKARSLLLANAENEIEARKRAAVSALQRERDEATTALRANAAALAGDLAQRLLERLPAATLSGCFIAGIADKLAALAPAEQALLHSDAMAPVDVVAAAALDDESRARMRKILADLTGHPAQATFSVDASLIAGIEVRFRHLVVRNHWAADLKRLLQRLNDHDEPARQI